MPPHRTRTMASDADFDFITKTILGQKQDSPLLKALEESGIDDVSGITSLNDRVIDRLRYQDDSSGTNVSVELGNGHQQLLRCFNAFVLFKNDEGDPIHRDWQNRVVKAEFQEYRLIGFAAYNSTRASTPTNTTTGGTTGTNTPFRKVVDRVLEFKKGIKRDSASFTILKDNKQ